MESIIIGFGNKARHGKDYCVQSIIERYGDQYKIKRYSFAEVLKAEYFDILMNTFDPYWDFCKQFLVPSYLTISHPREALATIEEKVAWINEHKEDHARHLQVYGTEYRRRQNPFYWVNAVRAIIEREKPQFALISDMRFKNEYAFVKAFKGYTVKVLRYNEDGTLWLDPTRDANHPSETDLDSVPHDYTIQCLSGALEELKRDAYEVFESVLNSQPAMPDFSDVAETLGAAA